ncbi:thiosulfate oxidation carrier protein SoxY [Aquabacterium sp. A7-Y]|uniref:thiosulfate oxidation carrier protein SoxY n=1 Tax=Aquabacterium sp. A7-Y TaxID=1349605 RepID=UPI00223D0703|nr:thiosulfate oxidation carrier protein SoxY [Aquabacterium sp. A7-Y]MCW7540369.1 thiosulfate oxidation carrier protein SoxY [Aquabacterium sp. A7-Y]
MPDRRQILQGGTGTLVLGLAASAGLLPAPAQAAWNQAAFKSRSLTDVARALGGAAPQPSTEVLLSVPEIAENGSLVRVTAASRLPGTTQLALLVEKNPNALAAVFELPEGTEASFAINLKLSETSMVYALVKAGGGYHYAGREVKVTLGGCGS